VTKVAEIAVLFPYRSGFKCERGQSPRHVISGARRANVGCDELPGYLRTRRHDDCGRGLLSPETELRPDHRDGVAIQHLDRPHENNGFFYFNVV
jgi:hypothetical protein